MKRRLSTLSISVISFLLGAFLVGGSVAVATGLIATPTTSKVYVDGKEVTVAAYVINENNYFKLRDFCSAVDIGVWWDGKNNSVRVETDKGYDPTYTGQQTEVKEQNNTKDNTKEITQLEQQLKVLALQKATAESSIRSLQTQISNYESLLNKYQSELSSARTTLENVENQRTVRMFSDGAWIYVADPIRVQEAQKDVEYYGNLVAQQENNVELRENELSQYNAQLKTIESQIFDINEKIKALGK